METFLIYLLKSAGLSSIFILIYLLLLKNDTAFHHNRNFLLGGIFASLVLPAVVFTRKVFAESTTASFNYDSPLVYNGITTASPTDLDWWQIFGIIYFTVFSFLLFKFLLQFYSVNKLISGLPKTQKNGYSYCTSSENIKPFSFFRYVIYNPELHTPEELDMILTHEEAHARQWHSLDVLLVHLFNAVLWFNPLTWIYKKSLIRNLEFLADKEVVEKAPSKKEYQKTLLKVTVGGFYPALTNPFYQSFLKKRIMMLNKNSSSKNPFWKASLVLPFIFIFMITFNVKTEAQVKTTELVYDGTLSFKDISNKEASIDNGASDLNDKINEKPLLIISGKEYRKDNLNGKTIWIKGDLNVLNTSEGYNRFGNRGRDGVIIISEGEILEDYEAHLKRIDSENKNVNRQYLRVLNNHKPLFATLVNKEKKFIPDAEEIIAVQYDHQNVKFDSQENKALIVIDGDVQGKGFYLQSVQHEKIKRLNILKGESAVEKYGSKGKNGVIEIDLKSKEEPENPKDQSKKAQQRNEDKGPVKFKAQSLKSEASDKKDGTSFSNSGVDAAQFNSKAVLFVVDGKEMENDFDASTISPEEIEAITVLKGDKSTEKYGQKGKEGAIDITTKK